MARKEKAIFTNMCMITDGSGNVLVEDRLNPDWPGVTFPGGHVEPGESFVDSVIREVYEETGLTIEDPVLCGVKQFPISGESGENGRYLVFLFVADKFSGEVISSEEGAMHWVKKEDLGKVNLVKDFKELLEVMLDENLSEFQYVVEDGKWKVVQR